MTIDPQWKKIAIELARQAGEIMRQHFYLGRKKMYKDDRSAITETDLLVNSLVLEILKKNFPDHGIIAEEGSDFDNQEFAWVCDPLDGTMPYARGIPTFTFALSLLQHGDPLLAVVFDPMSDRIFVAEKNQGATLNGKKIQVSTKTPNERPFICMGYMGSANATQKVIPKNWMTTVHERVTERNYASIDLKSGIYMGAMVAAGEFEALVLPARNPWDCATTKILVEEAGGKVTNLFGQDQRYDRETLGILCSNGSLHDTLLSFLPKNLALL